MKKTILMTIACSLLLGVFAGCAAPKANDSAASAQAVDPAVTEPIGVDNAMQADAPAETNLEGDARMDAGDAGETAPIAIYIKQRTVTVETTEVALAIVNQSDKTYSYDYVEHLERLNNDVWEIVPLTNEAVAMALMTIPAGETQELMFDFANHFDPLTHGTYRIVKTFADIDGNGFDAICEFDVF